MIYIDSSFSLYKSFPTIFRCPHWFGLHFDTKNDMRPFLRDRPFSLASPVRCMEIFSCPRSRLAIILIESVTEKIWSCFASAGYDANSEAYSRILMYSHRCETSNSSWVVVSGGLASLQGMWGVDTPLRLARGTKTHPAPDSIKFIPNAYGYDINSSSQPSFYITIGSCFKFLLYWNPQIRECIYRDTHVITLLHMSFSKAPGLVSWQRSSGNVLAAEGK